MKLIGYWMEDLRDTDLPLLILIARDIVGDARIPWRSIRLVLSEEVQ